MAPETVERVIHRPGFDRADAAATHRIIKHPVAIRPRPIVLFVGDVVEHGTVAIFSFEGSAHDRPERARNGCAIDDRSGRRDPNRALRIGVTQFAEQRHGAAVAVPTRIDRAAVVTPLVRLQRAGGPLRRIRAT